MSAVRLSAEGQFLYKQINDLRDQLNNLDLLVKEILEYGISDTKTDETEST